jgi:hypothetical protein
VVDVGALADALAGCWAGEGAGGDDKMAAVKATNPAMAERTVRAADVLVMVSPIEWPSRDVKRTRREKEQLSA